MDFSFYSWWFIDVVFQNETIRRKDTMKKSYTFLTLIMLIFSMIPGIYAEIDGQYLEKALDIQNQKFVKQLDDRDVRTEKEINAKFESFMSEYQNNQKMLYAKIWCLIALSVVYGGITLYSLNYFLDKQKFKIDSKMQEMEFKKYQGITELKPCQKVDRKKQIKQKVLNGD